MSRSNSMRCIILALSSLMATPVFAQTYLNQVGNTPFNTSIPVEQGSYDASTGNLHVEIPLGSWPQRGGSTVTASLTYDSRIWTQAYGVSSLVWQPVNIPGTGGWTLRYTPGMTGSNVGVQSASTYPCPNDPYYTTFYTVYSGYIWADSSGTIHTFAGNTTSDPNGCVGDSPNTSGPASDATGYSATIVNYTQVDTVTAPDGSLIYPYFRDPNGNYISWGSNGSITDTLGRTPVIITSSCNGNSNQTCYDVLNAQGGRSRYVMTTAAISVNTAFYQSGVTEFSGTMTVVSDIQLPNNTHYSFTYDNGSSGTYGELASMALPTGGTINYTFTNFFDAFGNVNQWLYTKTASGNQWAFAPSVNSSNSQSVMVTKPSGDKIGLSFTLDASANGAWNSAITYYNSSGGTMAGRYTAWSGGPTDIQRLADSTTMYDLPTAITKQTQYNYRESDGPWLTSIKEWSWQQGYGVTGTADRMTSFSNYCGTSPRSIVVTNGAQNITASQTNITYDGSGLANVTGAANHDDPDFGTSNLSRCNPTQVQRWTGSVWLTTSMTYDTTGQVRSIQDPNGNTTSFDYTDYFYDDNGANPPASHSGAPFTNAYVTTVTQPILGASLYSRYYYGTGQPAFAVDVNNQYTYSHFQDPFSRPTRTNFPDGGQSSISYIESSPPFGISYVTAINSSQNLVSTTVLDNLGRPSQSQLNSDPQGVDYVETSYDSNGRVACNSNPHRSLPSSTDGTTCYAYDALDRLTTTTLQAGGQSAISYSGSCINTFDPAGKKRGSCFDGFGRLTGVWEPDSGNNLTIETDYSYDLNNNLIGVNQGGQTRTYAYDALSRVTSATTPESGTTSFTYDNNGNVHTRIDARNITTTYSYDALNRLTSSTYSDGTPGAYFYYDQTAPWTFNLSNPLGRLTELGTWSGSGWTTLGIQDYDAMGRLKDQWYGTPVNIGVSSWYQTYTHDFLGNLTSYSDGMGNTISQSFDTAGRVAGVTSSLQDANHPATLASGISYAPVGTMTQATYGNGLIDTRAYNNRLQPSQMRTYRSDNNVDVMNFTFGFTDSNGHNNGNLMNWWSAGTSGQSKTFARSYGYDQLNRLSTYSSPADPTGWCLGLSWSYDRWGNNQAQSVTSGSCWPWSLGFDANNHINNSGFAYDAAGDLVYDGQHNYAYDAENRMISVDAGATASYAYDALGRRVRKITGSGATDYLHDAGGSVITEVDGSGNWQRGYVHLNGELLALYSGGTTSFILKDHLGSTRAVTALNGNVYDWMDYIPFGGQIDGGYSTTHQFTGFERDAYQSTADLDYSMLRYYTHWQGRWSSPDPLAGDISDPQSLNRYPYVSNNPLSYIDPYGADKITFAFGTCPPTAATCTIVGTPIGPGSSYATGGGGAAGGGGDMFALTAGQKQSDNPQSFVDCWVNLTAKTSLQTTFHAGNSFTASALFGNNVLSTVQTGADLANGKPVSAAKDAASVAATNLLAPAAKIIPNVAVTAPVVKMTASFSFSATATDITIVAKQTATVTNVLKSYFPVSSLVTKAAAFLNVFTLPKLTYDVSSAGLSALSCKMSTQQ